MPRYVTEQELRRILQKESNALDWKKGGDPENIVETLTAFANDYEEVGCGFVLCGIKEQKYKDGSSTSEVAGITRGVGQTSEQDFELSRNRAHPPITPRFDLNNRNPITGVSNQQKLGIKSPGDNIKR